MPLCCVKWLIPQNGVRESLIGQMGEKSQDMKTVMVLDPASEKTAYMPLPYCPLGEFHTDTHTIILEVIIIIALIYNIYKQYRMLCNLKTRWFTAEFNDSYCCNKWLKMECADRPAGKKIHKVKIHKCENTQGENAQWGNTTGILLSSSRHLSVYFRGSFRGFCFLWSSSPCFSGLWFPPEIGGVEFSILVSSEGGKVGPYYGFCLFL